MAYKLTANRRYKFPLRRSRCRWMVVGLLQLVWNRLWWWGRRLENHFSPETDNVVKRFFYSPTDAQVNCLKNNFRFYIKINIKIAPTCFGAVTPSSGSALFVLAKASTNNNNFKIVFKTIHLCISWWTKNLW